MKRNNEVIGNLKSLSIGCLLLILIFGITNCKNAHKEIIHEKMIDELINYTSDVVYVDSIQPPVEGYVQIRSNSGQTLIVRENFRLHQIALRNDSASFHYFPPSYLDSDISDILDTIPMATFLSKKRSYAYRLGTKKEEYESDHGFGVLRPLRDGCYDTVKRFGCCPECLDEITIPDGSGTRLYCVPRIEFFDGEKYFLIKLSRVAEHDSRIQLKPIFYRTKDSLNIVRFNNAYGSTPDPRVGFDDSCTENNIDFTSEVRVVDGTKPNAGCPGMSTSHITFESILELQGERTRCTN